MRYLKYAFLLLLVCLILSCGTSKSIDFDELPEPEFYILLDDSFFSSLKGNIVQSHIESLKREKEALIQFGKDEGYLKHLEESIKNPYPLINDTFYDSSLSGLIKKLEGNTVRNIYILEIMRNGETIYVDNYLLIEGFDHYDLYEFNSNKSDCMHYQVTMDLVNFTHEFMLNVPYSFENKTFYNNNVQYMTIDRISAKGKNTYSVSSVILPKVLNYQISIIQTFFDDSPEPFVYLKK